MILNNVGVYAVVAAVSLGVGVGIYTMGYKAGVKKAEVTILEYKDKVHELKNELNKAQSKVDVRVETEYIDRVKIVKQKEIQYVERATNSVVGIGNLSSGWVYVHDSAATGAYAEASPSSDGTPSRS